MYVQPSGPEGLRDYRAHLVSDPQAVGIGAVSSEQTLDSAYVLRPAPGATFERPRSCRPGEIGWGIPGLVDYTPANTGQQIMLGDFRQMAEDRVTHEGTGAWSVQLVFPCFTLHVPGSMGEFLLIYITL
ncbi:hypothetical protein PoB_003077500 [Plakobranchus ocellatus]|uniref:Uncharacterized protein n=1 Tax=Plakobranchus ocellatus TaxID=259542 RepID=A0AAV4A7X2_9GAST|nr:hypothetical protein PoB_003077500 [Plakobranchus ocellatus]